LSRVLFIQNLILIFTTALLHFLEFVLHYSEHANKLSSGDGNGNGEMALI